MTDPNQPITPQPTQPAAPEATPATPAAPAAPAVPAAGTQTGPQVTSANPEQPDSNAPAPTPDRTVEEDYYCPACGRKYNYPQKCTGGPANGYHPPVEVVSTDEIQGLEPGEQRDGLTAAPNTDQVEPHNR